jgi:hypothetical protein
MVSKHNVHIILPCPHWSSFVAAVARSMQMKQHSSPAAAERNGGAAAAAAAATAAAGEGASNFFNEVSTRMMHTAADTKVQKQTTNEQNVRKSSWVRSTIAALLMH